MCFFGLPIRSIFLPNSGTYKIIGLINGREFEGQLFAIDKPSYEDQFEFKIDADHLVGDPFSITLHDPNLEVDIFGNQKSSKVQI